MTLTNGERSEASRLSGLTASRSGPTGRNEVIWLKRLDGLRHVSQQSA
jgi:hypothetical protein